MADKQLIDACFMWCVTKGIDPKSLGDYGRETRALVRMAVQEYDGDFAKLNDRQRTMIAGLHI